MCNEYLVLTSPMYLHSTRTVQYMGLRIGSTFSTNFNIFKRHHGLFFVDWVGGLLSNKSKICPPNFRSPCIFVGSGIE